MLVCAYVEAAKANSLAQAEAGEGEAVDPAGSLVDEQAGGLLVDEFMPRIASNIVSEVEGPILVRNLVPHTPEEEIVLSPKPKGSERPKKSTDKHALKLPAPAFFPPLPAPVEAAPAGQAAGEEAAGEEAAAEEFPVEEEGAPEEAPAAEESVPAKEQPKVMVGALVDLSEDFIQDLFDAVRFPLLSHDQLLQAGRKEYVPKQNIVEAISARLNPYEEAESAHLAPTESRPPPGEYEGAEGTVELGEEPQKAPSAAPPTRAKAPHAARTFGEEAGAGKVEGRDVHICNYVSDFDRNGILYYVGSNYGNSVWTNPSAKGRVCVLASSCGHGEPHDLVGRTVANFRTKDEEGAWVIVDFGERRRAQLTHYSLMARQFKSHYPRGWVLEGSVDGSQWIGMIAHEEEDAMAGGGGTTFTWRLADTMDANDATSAMQAASCADLPAKFVRFVRVRQTAPNSSGSYNLMLSCMEFYGLLYTE